MTVKKMVRLTMATLMLSTSIGAFSVSAQELFSAKFDFGAETNTQGSTSISSTDIFTEEIGYGIIPTDGLTNGGNVSPDALYGDYVTSATGDIRFDVVVPDGDYEVKMINGGDTSTEVNIYINGGERVRVFTVKENKYQESVQRVLPKDGKISFQFLGKDVKVNSIEITQLPERTSPQEKPTIYIAGDSTAQTYRDTDYPQAGWGQTVDKYFQNNATVVNRSIGGRSTKSYDNDGRLDSILTDIHPNDYLLIQFGHNDGSSKPERFISIDDFKVLLTEKYIKETVKRGAIPVLLTPTTRGDYDEETGIFIESIKDYSDAIREVAEKENVPLIDINNDSRNLWTELGFDVVKTYYYICEPNESVKYPEGTNDRTHFKLAGADAISKLVVKGLREHVPALIDYTYDPTDLPSIEFTDIDRHWAKDYIDTFSKTRIVEGITETEFVPDKTITRAEFLTMTMRVAKITGKAWREADALDITSTDWFRFDVQGALDKELIAPEMIVDNKFNPNNPITREEMASILVRALRFANVELTEKNKDSSFVDSDLISEWAKDDIVLAWENGLIKGYYNENSTEIKPNNTATRAEAVALLTRSIDLIKK